MAEVFRPIYTVLDPATGKRVRKKSRTWHIRYYVNGVRQLGHAGQGVNGRPVVSPQPTAETFHGG